jgi:hypothetical protein
MNLLMMGIDENGEIFVFDVPSALVNFIDSISREQQP